MWWKRLTICALHSFRHVLTKSDQIRHAIKYMWGCAYFYGSDTPPWQGAGPPASQIFVTPTYAQTVWPRSTKFGTVTHVRGGPVSMSHQRPIPRQLCKSVPNYWDLLHRPTDYGHTEWETAAKFSMVIKLHDRKKITGTTTPACPGQKILWHECWCAFCLR